MNDPVKSEDHRVVLEAVGITKQYGAQLALNNVSIRVRSGAVNVLIGENGAGKSTLMRILAGIERPTFGQILLDGARVDLHSPRDAAALGIAIVHQELSVMGNLNIVENLFAGREVVRAGVLVNSAVEQNQSQIALKSVGMPTSPFAMELPAEALSLGCRQLVELARSFAHKARILILDEPTSALSTTEADILCRVIEDLKLRGVAIIYISHRLHELLHLGDYFVVLRDGRVVGEGARGGVDRAWIVDRMSGSSVEVGQAKSVSAKTEIVMDVSGLCSRQAGRPTVEDVNFSLHRGEIVGVYGLLGSGRTELLEALAGLRPPNAGLITVCGRPLRLKSVLDAIGAGIALVPEDRQRDSLVPGLSILENISLAARGRFTRYGVRSRSAESAAVKEVAARLHIAAADFSLPVTTLSGGNQQKVVLARCLMMNPVVLLLDEPTRGVDVRAKDDIYRTLRALAAQDLSILFTSSEIEETRLLADRVLTMARGSLVAEFSGGEVRDEDLFAAASPTLELSK